MKKLHFQKLICGVIFFSLFVFIFSPTFSITLIKVDIFSYILAPVTSLGYPDYILV